MTTTPCGIVHPLALASSVSCAGKSGYPGGQAAAAGAGAAALVRGQVSQFRNEHFIWYNLSVSKRQTCMCCFAPAAPRLQTPCFQKPQRQILVFWSLSRSNGPGAPSFCRSSYDICIAMPLSERSLLPGSTKVILKPSPQFMDSG